MELKPSLGFIGGGMMATAIIKSLINRAYPAGEIMVFDPDPTRLKELAKLQVITCRSNQELLHQVTGGVVLAVKPQVAAEVLQALEYPPSLPLLSIVAGFSLAKLAKVLPQGARIIRAMPNTPGLIQAGITALTPGPTTLDQDLAWGRRIMEALGPVVVVPEQLMNGVTAISGSGPGYVYLFIESLIEAGVYLGLPRKLARELAVQTVIGSARMLAETGEHPGVLKDMVTSPGGTTITGLAELETAGFTGLIMKAVSAAARKSEELGEK